MPLTEEQIMNIVRSVWEEKAPELNPVIDQIGMPGFQARLTHLFNVNRTYHLSLLLASVLDVTVNDWEVMRQVVNDRNDPVDRAKITSDVLAAIRERDSEKLAPLIPILIAVCAANSSLPQIPPFES